MMIYSFCFDVAAMDGPEEQLTTQAKLQLWIPRRKWEPKHRPMVKTPDSGGKKTVPQECYQQLILVFGGSRRGPDERFGGFLLQTSEVEVGL